MLSKAVRLKNELAVGVPESLRALPESFHTPRGVHTFFGSQAPSSKAVAVDGAPSLLVHAIPEGAFVLCFG